MGNIGFQVPDKNIFDGFGSEWFGSIDNRWQKQRWIITFYLSIRHDQ